MRIPQGSRPDSTIPLSENTRYDTNDVQSQIRRELAELVPMAPVTAPISGPRATPHLTTAAVRHLYQSMSGMSLNDPCVYTAQNHPRDMLLDFNGDPMTNAHRPLFRSLANQSASNAERAQTPAASQTAIYAEVNDQTAVSGLCENDWMSLALVDTDGGEMAPEFCAENALRNDRSVYSSGRRSNINILLENTTPLTPMHGVPCVLHEVCIRVPESGYTAPLQNGFIFVCSEPVSLDAFDTYNSVDTTLLLNPRARGANQMLPQVPSSVRTVLYFQLDPNASVFRYKFQTSISDARYVLVKMLSSVRDGDNIDVEFLGFKGTLCKLAFPYGNLA